MKNTSNYNQLKEIKTKLMSYFKNNKKVDNKNFKKYLYLLFLSKDEINKEIESIKLQSIKSSSDFETYLLDLLCTYSDRLLASKSSKTFNKMKIPNIIQHPVKYISLALMLIKLEFETQSSNLLMDCIYFRSSYISEIDKKEYHYYEECLKHNIKEKNIKKDICKSCTDYSNGLR